MDLGVFYEVIVPLLSVLNTALICISTPLGSWNFYSELTELRNDTGDRLFNVIKIGMACDACKGTPTEDECPHGGGTRPPWQTDGFDKAAAIFGDRKAMFRREILGQIADEDNLAFEVPHLKRLFAKKGGVPEPHPRVNKVYMAIDPNGGASGTSGTGSATAIVSFYYQGANVVVRYLLFLVGLRVMSPGSKA